MVGWFLQRFKPGPGLLYDHLSRVQCEKVPRFGVEWPTSDLEYSLTRSLLMYLCTLAFVLLSYIYLAVKSQQKRRIETKHQELCCLCYFCNCESSYRLKSSLMKRDLSYTTNILIWNRHMFLIFHIFHPETFSYLQLLYF